MNSKPEKRAGGYWQIKAFDFMDAPTFTLLTQKLGIHRRYISIGVATALAAIKETPIPLSSSRGGEKSTSNKPLAVGPLINHGFVQLCRQTNTYRITQSGVEYLTLLRHHNLLP